MYTLILCGAFLVIASYYDIKSRTLPILMAPAFCGAGFLANVILGSEVNSTVFFLLFLCLMYHLAVIAKLFGRDDAWMLCAVTLTVPFIPTSFGYIVPSIILIGAGLFTAFCLYLAVCVWKNRGHTMKKRARFARMMMHVNNGEKFVVPAHTHDSEGKKRFSMSHRGKIIGKCDAEYVMPVLPMLPIFAVWYGVVLFVFL